MKVIDLINSSKSTAFSFEILPPLKGNSIQKVYNVIDKLIEFDPKYINITSHHSEYIYKTLPDGSFQKVNIRKRPGSVAIASAIQNKYGITRCKNTGSRTKNGHIPRTCNRPPAASERLQQRDRHRRICFRSQ